MCDSKVKISIQCNKSSKASLETYPTPPPPPQPQNKQKWIRIVKHHYNYWTGKNNSQTSLKISRPVFTFFLPSHTLLLLCVEHRYTPRFFASKFNFHVQSIDKHHGEREICRLQRCRKVWSGNLGNKSFLHSCLIAFNSVRVNLLLQSFCIHEKSQDQKHVLLI